MNKEQYKAELLNMIENTSPVLAYLFFNQHIEFSKELFNDDFDDICNLITLYKNLGFDIKPGDTKYVLDLYEGVIKLENIFDELNEYDKHYIRVIKVLKSIKKLI